MTYDDNNDSGLRDFLLQGQCQTPRRWKAESILGTARVTPSYTVFPRTGRESNARTLEKKRKEMTSTDGVGEQKEIMSAAWRRLIGRMGETSPFLVLLINLNISEEVWVVFQ